MAFGRPLRAVRNSIRFTGRRAAPGSGTSTPVPVNTSVPVISGTIQVGQTISFGDGTWTNLPSSYARQLQSSANGTTGWTDVAGATGTSLLLDVALQDLYLRLGVIASNAGGPSAVAYSSVTVQVAASGGGSPIANPVIEVQRSTSNEVIYQLVTPATWPNDVPTFVSPGFAMVRTYYWQADGVDITGATAPTAVGTTYSAGRAQSGKSIRVKELAWFVASPGTIYTSYSNAITAPSTFASDIVYHDDIQWLGAFRYPNTGRDIPYYFNYGGFGLSFDPAGDSGAGSLFAFGHDSGTYLAELTIPSVSTSVTTYGSLPVANLLQYTDDAFNGRTRTVGVINAAAAFKMTALPDGANLIMSMHVIYPSFLEYGGGGIMAPAYFFRRSKTLSSSAAIEGPFRVVDPNRDAPRASNGYLSKVPAALQTSLGGTHLHGLIPDSGGAFPSSSNGPSLNTMTLADFNSATSHAFPFDVVAATTTTVTLPGTASATTGFYVGDYVQLIPTGADPGGPRLVTAYNGTTKVATFTPSWSAPSAGAKAQMVANVASKALANYDVSPYGNNVNGWNTLNRVWDNSGNINAAIIPPGTKSALCIGSQGHGIWQYTNNDPTWQSTTYSLTLASVATAGAQWTATFTDPSGILSGSHVVVQGSNKFYVTDIVGSVVTLKVHDGSQFAEGPVPGAGGAPVNGSAFYTLNYTYPFYAYDPIGTSTGEHAYPYHLKIWTYNTDDLAAVKANTLPLQNIRPTQMFNFTLPGQYDKNHGYIAGAAYDSATKRLYVSMSYGNSSGEPAIHVFQINNATVE